MEGGVKHNFFSYNKDLRTQEFSYVINSVIFSGLAYITKGNDFSFILL